MAFAGIFQPFARLRWIRFGLLMRDRKILAPLVRSANNGFSRFSPPTGRLLPSSVRFSGNKEGWSVSIFSPLLPPGPARTETYAALVIFLSLAVFDRVSSRRTCRERRT
jgi:hypothetical protein